MKKILIQSMKKAIFGMLMLLPVVASGQVSDSCLKEYLDRLPPEPAADMIQKYRMTAIYTNRDLYGNFTGKTMIKGDYTRGLENGFAEWNNAFIAEADNYDKPFPEGKRLTYLDEFRYKPSLKMLEPEFFRGFPNSPESVLGKNMIWDMFTFDEFGYKFRDSLKLNKIYRIRDTGGQFEMADIGKYAHKEIQVCWTGISAFNDEMCALIEFRTIDNMIELNMPGLKTRGTEQYWGTIWISYNTGLIAHAEMYSGTIQEIEVSGMQDKMITKTIRELWVDKN
jgi:hypothetical protein